MSQQIRHIAQIACVNTNGIEGATGEVEFIAQTNIDIGNLLFLSSAARPLREGLKELFRCDKEMCDGFLDLRDLFIGLEAR